MSVTHVHKDVEALTMRVDAGFDASVDGVAAVGRPAAARALVGAADLSRHLHRAQPRPRRHRALLHDRPGGRPPLRVVADHERGAAAPVAFDDGFADAEGNELDTMPSMTVAVALRDGGRRHGDVDQSTFPTLEAIDKILAMEMEKGLARPWPDRRAARLGPRSSPTAPPLAGEGRVDDGGLFLDVLAPGRVRTSQPCASRARNSRPQKGTDRCLRCSN